MTRTTEKNWISDTLIMAAFQLTNISLSLFSRSFSFFLFCLMKKPSSLFSSHRHVNRNRRVGPRAIYEFANTEKRSKVTNCLLLKIVMIFLEDAG